MENPLTWGSHSQEDLFDYAYWRKCRELESVKRILKDSKVESGEISPEELEDYREPLALSRNILVNVELSTGGDADGFKLTFSEEKELLCGVYYWADWGVYEEVNLQNSELDLIDQLYNVTEWLKSL